MFEIKTHLYWFSFPFKDIHVFAIKPVCKWLIQNNLSVYFSTKCHGDKTRYQKTCLSTGFCLQMAKSDQLTSLFLNQTPW